jgi:uncharacterized protein DUF5063
MTTVLDRSISERYMNASRAFIAVVDGRRSMAPEVWVGRVHPALAELYAAALALPEVESVSPNQRNSRMSDDAWRELYHDMGAILGRWNYYWDIFDPYNESDREPVCGSLADDLADIYRDVSDGLPGEKTTTNVSLHSDVIWGWRFGFESHWAYHATGALRAINKAMFSHHAGEVPESFGS